MPESWNDYALRLQGDSEWTYGGKGSSQQSKGKGKAQEVWPKGGKGKADGKGKGKAPAGSRQPMLNDQRYAM